MINDDKNIDILLIEDSTAIIDLFKVLTKKFDLKIKFVKNTFEFMDAAQKFDFKYILCDLDLDYKLEGYFIARIHTNLRKYKNKDSKMILFTSDDSKNSDMVQKEFDYALKKEFYSIYEFLLENFELRSYHDLLKVDSKYCIPSVS